MSHDQPFSAVEAVRGRLVEEVTAQLALLEEGWTRAVEDARRAAEKLAEERWAIRVEAVKARLGDERGEARARAAAREAHVDIVDRLAAVFRTIEAGRSLSDTLTALVLGAASVAPRVALFTAGGGQLQWWGASGFADEFKRQSAAILPDGALADAIASRAAVLTTVAAPPAFADLPPERSGVAVPILVGGAAVGVLYADEGVGGAEAPAFSPRAVEILAQHASLCLAHVTALRTIQALSVTPAASVAEVRAEIEAADGQAPGATRVC